MASRRNVSWSTNLSLDSSSHGSSTTALASGGKPPRPTSSRRGKLPPSLKKPSFASTHVTCPPPPPPRQRTTKEAISKVTPGSPLTADLASVIVAKHAQELKESRKGKESWRKHGKLFRATLIMTDEESGGNTFVLSNNCSIEKYYEVAERVLDQFLKHSVDEKGELTESYLVGNRLVKFLATVLPTHIKYFAVDARLEKMRARSQAQLVQLLQYLEHLALIIDEDELNKYILNDLKDETRHFERKTSPERNTESNPSTDTIEKFRNLNTSPIPVSVSDGSIASNVSSHLVGELSSSVSSGTLNTTFETTLTTPIGDLDVIDMDFFAARDVQVLSLQQEEANAWDTTFSLQYGKEPIRDSDDRPVLVQNTAFSRVDGDWDPEFPFAFNTPEKSRSPITRLSQDPTPRTSNQRSSLPGRPMTPVDSGMYANRNVDSPIIKEYSSQVTSWHEKEPMERESSPKSIMELSEWGVEDQLLGDPSFQFLSADGDDRSITTNEQEELSLTSLAHGINRRRNKNQLSKFKGCIRCLLD